MSQAERIEAVQPYVEVLTSVVSSCCQTARQHIRQLQHCRTAHKAVATLQTAHTTIATLLTALRRRVTHIKTRSQCQTVNSVIVLVVDVHVVTACYCCCYIYYHTCCHCSTTFNTAIVIIVVAVITVTAAVHLTSTQTCLEALDLVGKAL